MNEAIPFALGAAAVVLIRPLRRRVGPVARSTLAAGLSVATAVVGGATGIVTTAVRGETPTGGVGTGGEKPRATRAAKA
jgi:hypothetical protein